MLHQSLIVTHEKVQNYVDAVHPLVLHIQQDRKCTHKRNIGCSFVKALRQWKSGKHYIF